jgi:hypothetical protein
MSEDTRREHKAQVNRLYASYLGERCGAYLKPVLTRLNKRMDRRLVKTFFGLVMVLLIHRHRNQGMVLSELGGYLLSPERSPAGTKRISNLLRSEKWSAEEISQHLWEEAEEQVMEMQASGEQVLAIWDESVIEKAESLKAEGLCPVRSSKAVRLKRIKPGYFNPPGGRPIFVPGFHWLQVLVLGMKGAPTLAHMRWWTTRGEEKSDRRSQEKQVLGEICNRLGLEVLHVFDRGFAGNPWLTLLYVHAVRFVLRWPKNYKLIDEQGRLRKPGEISKGKRSWDYRLLWDAKRRCQRKVGVIAFPVQDPSHQQNLWLVIAPPGRGRTPWYLLTSQSIASPDHAWRIVLAYARRWQVEMSIRFHKCELAFESPRLMAWESRRKLLLMATLAYAFLLSLLLPDPFLTTQWLLTHWCPRTGEWQQYVLLPLYRLRLALSQLWLFYSPIPLLRLN